LSRTPVQVADPNGVLDKAGWGVNNAILPAKVVDGVNEYLCNCDIGYHGDKCEMNIIDCHNRPCKNNGTCIYLVNGFQCNCSFGFTGPNCTVNFDDCASEPCV